MPYRVLVHLGKVLLTPVLPFSRYSGGLCCYFFHRFGNGQIYCNFKLFFLYMFFMGWQGVSTSKGTCQMSLAS